LTLARREPYVRIDPSRDGGRRGVRTCTPNCRAGREPLAGAHEGARKRAEISIQLEDYKGVGDK